LNTDASVRRLKGEERPLQAQAARAAIIGALRCVDLVVLFEEDTPLALIELIRPDVLIKGADHAAETVVGAEVVASYGGRLVLSPLALGHSTTDLVRRGGRPSR
jgi:D-beta-D-heptose 7-phosphate kinase/D-beta-D-heptose 1-phosphate adenosyltransferase